MDYSEWIELLPDILIYFVSGFAYYTSYTFVVWNDKNKDLSKTFMISITIGYIIYNSARLFPFTLGVYLDNILIILTSAVLGLVIGKISQSNAINKLYGFLGIYRSSSGILWYDIVRKSQQHECNILIKYKDKTSGYTYAGKLYMLEANRRTPYIVLTKYYILDTNMKLIEDWRLSKNGLIILQPEDSADFQIYYDTNYEILYL